MIKDNPTIERIRNSRHSISQKLDHNPKDIIKYYIQLQKKHKERLLDIALDKNKSNHVTVPTNQST